MSVLPICEESCRQPNDIYKIKGDGTFGSPSAVNLPNGFLGLVIADINGDGIPDLVNDYVEVALGKGGGKFRAPVYYPVDAPRDFGLKMPSPNAPWWGFHWRIFLCNGCPVFAYSARAGRNVASLSGRRRPPIYGLG